MEEFESGFERWRKIIGLFGGPILMLVIFMMPAGSLTSEAQSLLAIIALVVVYWISEALPLGVTALMAPVLCIIFGVCDEKSAFANFAHPIIFLFLGSFILAKAMEVHAIDKVIAIKILSLKWVRASALRFTFMFAFIIFVLSGWLSNTATTAMMFPIALSLIKRLEEMTGVEMKKFGLGLMLITAYSASIGGVATPVGSPPNLIGIGMLERMAGIKIGFFQWMIIAVPQALLIFLAVFFFMYGITMRSAKKYWNKELFAKLKQQEMQPLKREQWNVIIAFGITVILWILPGIIMLIAGRDTIYYRWLSDYIPEASAAMIGTVLLFLLPVNLKEFRPAMGWKQAVEINWEAIFLFGGGLTLGTLMFKTGLSEVAASAILEFLGQPSIAKFTLLFSFLTNSTTELTSNTAMANMAVPLAISLCQKSQLPPMIPALAATMGCSYAYMLPVGTPPNAIVYGSGLIPIKSMVKVGFLCLIGSSLLCFVYLMLVHILFGL